MADRLKTSEIKLLLRQCVQDGKNHPVDDFKKYIAQNAEKSFSIGQLSGAISQLTALKELENIGRGLYRKGPAFRDGTDEGDPQGRESRTGATGQSAPMGSADPAGMTGAAAGTDADTGNGEGNQDQTKEINEENEDEQIKKMWKELKVFLEEADQSLARIVGNANVWSLSNQEFELLREVRCLGEQMKAVAAKC